MYKITNRIEIVAFVALTLLPFKVRAQITDFVEDYVSDYISSQIGSVENYFYNSASNFWNNYVEDDARRSIIEKAHELQSFQPDQSQIKRLLASNRYTKNLSPNDNVFGHFPPIDSSISDQLKTTLYSTNDLELKALGNGKLLLWTDAYKDSLAAHADYGRLEDALSAVALDSLAATGRPDLRNSLLADINKDKRLVTLLNNHPQSMRVYANTFDTALKGDLSFLYYWSVTADSHRVKLPPKTTMLNPRQFTFEGHGNHVNIYSGNTQMGSIDLSTNQITVSSAELLCLLPKENTTYQYGETEYRTDMLGRVVSLTFSLKKSDKKKAKTPIKYKDLCQAVNVTLDSDLYSLLMKPYKETPSVAFAIPIDKSEQLLEQQKLLKKKMKKQMKENPSLNLHLSIGYNDMTNKPCMVNAYTYEENAKFDLVNNGTPLYETKNQTRKEDQQLLNKIKRAKVQNNTTGNTPEIQGDYVFVSGENQLKELMSNGYWVKLSSIKIVMNGNKADAIILGIKTSWDDKRESEELSINDGSSSFSFVNNVIKWEMLFFGNIDIMCNGQLTYSDGQLIGTITPMLYDFNPKSKNGFSQGKSFQIALRKK